MHPRETPPRPSETPDRERPEADEDRPASTERVNEAAEQEAREEAGVSAQAPEPMDPSLTDELRGEHSDPSVVGNTPADR